MATIRSPEQLSLRRDMQNNLCFRHRLILRRLKLASAHFIRMAMSLQCTGSECIARSGTFSVPTNTTLSRAGAVILLAATLCLAQAGLAIRLIEPVQPATALVKSSFVNGIYIGSNNGDLSTCGNLGFDFPLLVLGSPRQPSLIGMGVVAHTWLSMLPENRKFHVDNFYAVFGFYLSGAVGERLVWRLYPLYHLSAHLADGYPGPVSQDKLTISHEMVHASMSYTPFQGCEVLAGLGYYYHVVENRDLRAEVSLDWQYRYERLPWVSPFIRQYNRLVIEDRPRIAVEGSCGLLVHGEDRNRGLALSCNLFDRPHPGQYFKHNERGLGVSIQFFF